MRVLERVCSIWKKSAKLMICSLEKIMQNSCVKFCCEDKK